MNIPGIEKELERNAEDRAEVQELREYFSSNLRQLREEIGVNQDTFAKVMGVSRAALSYYENGSRTPDIDFINMLIVKTGCSPDYALGWSSVVNPSHVDIQYSLGIDERQVEKLAYLCDYREFGAILDSDELYNVLSLIRDGAQKYVNGIYDQELVLWKCLKTMENLVLSMFQARVAELLEDPAIEKSFYERQENARVKLTELLNKADMERAEQEAAGVVSRREAINADASNPFAAFRWKILEENKRIQAKQKR